MKVLKTIRSRGGEARAFMPLGASGGIEASGLPGLRSSYRAVFEAKRIRRGAMRDQNNTFSRVLEFRIGKRVIKIPQFVEYLQIEEYLQAFHHTLPNIIRVLP